MEVETGNGKESDLTIPEPKRFTGRMISGIQGHPALEEGRQWGDRVRHEVHKAVVG